MGVFVKGGNSVRPTNQFVDVPTYLLGQSVIRPVVIISICTVHVKMEDTWLEFFKHLCIQKGKDYRAEFTTSEQGLFRPRKISAYTTNYSNIGDGEFNKSDSPNEQKFRLFPLICFIHKKVSYIRNQRDYTLQNRSNLYSVLPRNIGPLGTPVFSLVHQILGKTKGSKRKL